MKIGIMGTHGCGKTKLAFNIISLIKNKSPKTRVELLYEVARQCPFKINQETTPETQQWIFHQQFVREIEKDAGSDILVCDRTVLDAVAYTHRAGFRSMVLVQLPQALEWFRSYDYVFWVRPDGKPVHDGVRDTDPVFQKEIDDIFRQWIKSNNLPVMHPDKAALQVLNILNGSSRS